MRLAMRHIAGNVVWSASGEVWAVWRVEPQGGPYVGGRERIRLTGRVTGLLRSLPKVARLYSLCAQIDPGEVAARMVQGLELEECPHWAEVASSQLDLLDGVEMHQRTLWLAVPLSSTGWRAELSATFGAAWSEVSAVLGMRPALVAEEEVVGYLQQARRLAAEFDSYVDLRPARPAEIVWMHQHAVHRGVEEPLLLEASRHEGYGGRLVHGALRSPSYADLGQVRVHEGGRQQPEVEEGEARRSRRRIVNKDSALTRTWLEVESAGGTGYQAHLALAEMPRAVAEKDADILAQLELLPWPVDVTVDMALVPAEKVSAEVTKRRRELLDQIDQRAAQHAIGLPEEMHDAADDLDDEGAKAAASQTEVEVRSITVLTVWAPTASECAERARTLQKRMGGANYRLIPPLGAQAELFALGLPGGARTSKAREFEQYQLSGDFAMNGALLATGFGDPTGQMVGISLDAGTVRPVLWDIADAPLQDASASLGVAGDLGGGKSVLLKLLASGIVDRGGRVIVIDRTPLREWAHFAQRAARGRCQVVDVARAQASIDPLRLFERGVAIRYARSYLSLQLGIGPMTAQGALLKKAVTAAADCPRPCMAQVLVELEEMAQGEGATARDAAALAALLQVVRDEPLAATVFDPDLPVLTLAEASCDAVVVTTAGLTLPPREAVLNPELMRTQPTEALIGRAVLYLVAALARETAFEVERFCQIVVDECYWLTTSAEGAALVHEVVSDGRKHNAGMALGAHDVRELGSDLVRGLLAYLVISRTTDRTLAGHALTALGLPADDEELLEKVMTLSPMGEKDQAGQMLGRDARRQVGHFQVLIPEVPRIRAGIFTTPGRADAGAGARQDPDELAAVAQSSAARESAAP
ncbi:ATP-binding protein [Streptomyces kronopolitis]|uniref:ATP-binding protein n=1 Tax=Streptomyces kronopolitis TaxID=1612435 RepID=UPI0036C17CE4